MIFKNIVRFLYVNVVLILKALLVKTKQKTITFNRMVSHTLMFTKKFK
jgi:hypothetical protein